MPANQANVEYFFRLLYDLLSKRGGDVDYTALVAFLTNLWNTIVIVGYAISVIGLFMIVYVLVRLFELREREEEYYDTVIDGPGAAPRENPRWKHIASLMESDRPGDWREAIIEADILLDDILVQHGFEGETLGDKLRNANPARFHTIKDAGEAHGVRNQIAHQGSAFELSESFARRVIQKYENVFREFKVV